MSQTKAQLLDGKSATIQFTGGSASVPSVSFTGNTNTGIYSPGADQVAISTGGSGRLFVDASGRVGIGTSTPETLLHVGNTVNNVFFDRNESVVGGPNAVFRKSRGIPASRTIVNAGDFLGALQFTGFDGSIYQQSAIVRGEADGAPSLGSVPGRLIFLTQSGGVTSERLRITSAGLVGIGTSTPGAGLHVANAPIWAGATTASTSGVIAMYGDGNNGTIEAFAGNNSSTKRNICLAPYGGSVGIGTTSPNRPLEVNGIIRTTATGTTSDASQAFEIVNSNAGVDPRVLVLSGTNNGSAIIRNASTTAGGIQFQIQGGEVARIDSSGRLLVGTSSARSGVFFNGDALAPTIQLEGTTSSTCYSATRVGNGAGDAIFVFAKARGTTVGSTTVVQSADGLGAITFQGADGSEFVEAARISAAVDGTPGANDMPGRLVFSTTADGASSPTERLRIDSSGRVGIGTTSPGAIVHSTVSSAGVVFRGSHNNSGIDLYANDVTGEARITATRLGGSGGKFLSFYTDTGTGEFERSRIDSSGRLLVGTSSAQGNGRIQVQGSNVESKLTMWRDNAPFGFINGTAGSSIEFGASPSSGVFGIGASIQFFGDQTWGSNDYPGRLVFSTTADGESSPTERMRISRDGAAFLVANVAYTSCTVSSTQSAGTTYALFAGKHSATNGASDSGTASVFIYTNGNVANTNNSYGAISDAKLKENIVDATSQWSDIKALQVRKYNFKEGQTHTQIGLVAQEVELVSPGLVTESPDRDEDGNDLGTVTKSVNYSVLYMKAVKALQEAMERIETLEAKVAALETP